MKIGILSDTHDQYDRTRLGLNLLQDQGCQYFIHCGDLVSAGMVELLAEFKASYFCLGNNDNETELRNQAELSNVACLGLGGILNIGNVKIAVSHGHHPPTLEKLLLKKPTYFLVGHAHQQRMEEKQGTLWINPGALHRAKPHSCALLNLKKGKVQFIEDFSV